MPPRAEYLATAPAKYPLVEEFLAKTGEQDRDIYPIRERVLYKGRNPLTGADRIHLVG